MAVSTIKEELSCNLEKVWNVVTSSENYSWRSDISKIEVLADGKKFVEYAKDGTATFFTITLFEPGKRYEFDMENEKMHGYWTGTFAYVNGKTRICFTEDVTAEKWFLKPFVGLYLSKQQSVYVTDLKRALGLCQ